MGHRSLCIASCSLFPSIYRMGTRALNCTSRDIKLNDAIPDAHHTGWMLNCISYLLDGTFCGDSASSGKCMCVAGAFPLLRYVHSIFLLWLALSVLRCSHLDGNDQKRPVGNLRMACIIRRYPHYPALSKPRPYHRATNSTWVKQLLSPWTSSFRKTWCASDGLSFESADNL